MGLRCLIGHEYGPPQTSRDQRQGGNEVVTTVREYRECIRCGHRRIISENTEVTADAPGAPVDGAAAEAAWAPDEDPEDDRAGETFPVSEVDLGREPVEVSADEPMTAEEDDGIILDDEPPGLSRAHGQWPEADLGEPPEADAGEPEPWPDEDVPAAETEALSAAPPTEEADGLATPSSDREAEPAGADDAVIEAASTPSQGPPPDPGSTELVCPDCGETWPSQNHSLRPGDICPACRRGYLDEQVVQ